MGTSIAWLLVLVVSTIPFVTSSTAVFAGPSSSSSPIHGFIEAGNDSHNAIFSAVQRRSE